MVIHNRKPFSKDGLKVFELLLKNGQLYAYDIHKALPSVHKNLPYRMERTGRLNSTDTNNPVMGCKLFSCSDHGISVYEEQMQGIEKKLDSVEIYKDGVQYNLKLPVLWSLYVKVNKLLKPSCKLWEYNELAEEYEANGFKFESLPYSGGKNRRFLTHIPKTFVVEVPKVSIEEDMCQAYGKDYSNKDPECQECHQSEDCKNKTLIKISLDKKEKYFNKIKKLEICISNAVELSAQLVLESNIPTKNNPNPTEYYSRYPGIVWSMLRSAHEVLGLEIRIKG